MLRHAWKIIVMHIRGWIVLFVTIVAVASSGSSDSANSAKQIRKGQKALKINARKHLNKKTKNLRKRRKKCPGRRRKETTKTSSQQRMKNWLSLASKTCRLKIGSKSMTTGYGMVLTGHSKIKRWLRSILSNTYQ